jgi:hypothetical protein
MCRSVVPAVDSAYSRQYQFRSTRTTAVDSAYSRLYQFRSTRTTVDSAYSRLYHFRSTRTTAVDSAYSRLPLMSSSLITPYAFVVLRCIETVQIGRTVYTIRHSRPDALRQSLIVCRHCARLYEADACSTTLCRRHIPNLMAIGQML